MSLPRSSALTPALVASHRRNAQRSMGPPNRAGQGLVAAERSAERVVLAGMHQLFRGLALCSTLPGGADGAGPPRLQTGSSPPIFGDRGDKRPNGKRYLQRGPMVACGEEIIKSKGYERQREALENPRLSTMY